MRTIIKEMREASLYSCLRLTLDVLVTIARLLRFGEPEQSALIRRLETKLQDERAAR